MTPPDRRLTVVLVLSVVLVPLTLRSQPPDTSLRAVVQAGSAYVAEYQRTLTSVVADESAEQEVVTQVPPARNAVRRRRTASEVFFMFTPVTNHWMAIRDVMRVDGRELENRPDIRRDLETLADDHVSAALKAQNSRYNIGRITRNFSEPTLCLLVLDERHRNRFKFDRKRVQNDAGVTVVTLTFAEKEGPTLIWDYRLGKVLSTGEILIEANTGRVRETTFRARSGDITLELTTKYTADERLNMWVPASFRESYEGGVDRRARDGPSYYEHVVAEATYSNYRRFQTAARIK